VATGYDSDPLVEPRREPRKFTPGAVRNIRQSLETLAPTLPCSSESLYQEILAVFLDHSQIRGAKRGGNHDAWLRFVPADIRFDTLSFSSLKFPVVISSPRLVYGLLFIFLVPS
jgi:hypothetical protein